MSIPGVVRRGARLVPLLLALPVSLAGQQRVSLAGDGVVYDLAGEVRLVPGGGSAIVVEVRPQGRDAGKLRVVSGTNGAWRTLRVLYPGDEIVYDRLRNGGRTNLRVHEDGTFDDAGFWRDAGQAGPGDRGREHWWDRDDSGRRVTIRGSGSGLHAFADMTVQVPAGRRVAVFLGVGRVNVENVNGQLWLSTAGGDVAASRVTGNVRVGTGSGDVQVLESAGDLVVGTGSGDVTVRGHRGGAGPLHLSTGSGTVRADNLTAGGINASTGSGDVEIRGVSASRADFSTGSGDITAVLTGRLEQVKISTGSGDVRVAVPANTGAQVRFSSGSGEVETDVPMMVTRRREGELIGAIGDGRGSIVVSTGSGDLHLTRS